MAGDGNVNVEGALKGANYSQKFGGGGGMWGGGGAFLHGTWKGTGILLATVMTCTGIAGDADDERADQKQRGGKFS